MWFANRTSRFQRVAQSIVDGLRDGSIVLDPPLAKDPPLAADPKLFTDWPVSTTSVPELTTASLRPGVYESFVLSPKLARPRRQSKKVRYGSERDVRFLVATGSPRQQSVGHPVML